MPGGTSIRPSSVAIRSAPCCGMISSSPSASTNTRPLIDSAARGKGAPPRPRGRPGRGWRASSPCRRRSRCLSGRSAGGSQRRRLGASGSLTVPGREQRRSLVAHEGSVIGGRPHPVQPAAPVLVPRRGEGAARQLLGIKAEGGPLRRVAALRQRALRPPRFRNGRRTRSCSAAHRSCARALLLQRAQTQTGAAPVGTAPARGRDSQPARAHVRTQL